MINVLIDCDEVLAQFMLPAIQLAEKISGQTFPLEMFKSSILDDTLPKDVMEKLWKEFNQPGYVENIEPYPQALKAIEELKSLDVELCCVTAPIRRSPTWAYERMNWLKKHFGLRKHQVIVTHAKYKVDGHIFIDDLPSHVMSWQKYPRRHPGDKAFLMANRFNVHEECDVERAGWIKILNHVGLLLV